ncbi:NAD(P)H-dependent oxidoreductase [Paenibacillus glycanilyticus]|uniref:NAD(P)H oxidoreductase YdeQ n=1 Tax=Paenibacillus glycanilyticus TaxID=126569 RepID=A0ABQ6G838_9BACL|nr:NAD(P)H-dependent oxidoreductase [Paenibacillus glycanilyticus]GLX65706.1 putative NAD(P)H oxidoreductase YdeQ [Paenibacillus glycanilyticus]
MRILVIAAHPRPEQSRANQALSLEITKQPDMDYRNLYEEYSDWNIDADKERELLLRYDRIVFQFPLYWYSCPPLMKKWFDDVLTFGWAFGPSGDRLLGKEFMLATTAGGTENSYRSGGSNRFTVSELLRPIEQTIFTCKGTFLPGFISYNANAGSGEYLADEAKRFAKHIRLPAEELVH